MVYTLYVNTDIYNILCLNIISNVDGNIFLEIRQYLYININYCTRACACLPTPITLYLRTITLCISVHMPFTYSKITRYISVGTAVVWSKHVSDL